MSKSTFTARFETLMAEIRVDGSRPKHIEKAMRRERRMGIAKGRREALAMKTYAEKENAAAFALLATSEKISKSLSYGIADANGTISRLERELAEKTKTIERNAKVIESQKWQLDTVARALGHSAGAHKTLGGVIDGIRANESRLQREVAKLERELAKTGKSTTVVEANDSIEVGDRFEWKDNPAGAFRIDSIAREVVYVYETTSATGHKTGSRSMNAAQAHIRAGRWVRLAMADNLATKSVSEDEKASKRETLTEAAIRTSKPILPSSLKPGQRVEYIVDGHAHRGVVESGVALSYGDPDFNGRAALIDKDAAALSIRLLSGMPNENPSERPEFVDVPRSWHGSGHTGACVTAPRWSCDRACLRRITWEAAGCPQ